MHFYSLLVTVFLSSVLNGISAAPIPGLHRLQRRCPPCLLALAPEALAVAPEVIEGGAVALEAAPEVMGGIEALLGMGAEGTEAAAGASEGGGGLLNMIKGLGQKVVSTGSKVSNSKAGKAASNGLDILSFLPSGSSSSKDASKVSKSASSAAKKAASKASSKSSSKDSGGLLSSLTSIF